MKNGAPGRIRTSDLVLRRHTLYPAELRARGVHSDWFSETCETLMLELTNERGTFFRFLILPCFLQGSKSNPSCARTLRPLPAHFCKFVGDALRRNLAVARNL